jgi:hypothetical protein
MIVKSGRLKCWRQTKSCDKMRAAKVSETFAGLYSFRIF